MRILVAALVGALSGFAFSASVIAQPAPEWTGVYAGVGGGYAAGDVLWNYDFGTTPHPNPLSVSGVVFGPHIVGEIQQGPFVFGVEAQALATTVTGKAVCPSPTYACTISNYGPLVIVGARAGLAFGDLMVYGTAGYAGGDIKTTARYVSNGALLEEGNAWHDGWAAGGGVDWQVTPSWVFGLQYLHVNLNTAEHHIYIHTGEDHAVSSSIDTLMGRVSFKFH